MSNRFATIAEIANRVIGPIVGHDTRVCEKLDGDHYEIYEVGAASDHTQVITSNHIVAGLYAWAGTALTDINADGGDRIIAQAVRDARWDGVAALLEASETDAQLDIWDWMGQIAAEDDTVTPENSPQAFNEMPTVAEQA